MLPSFHTDPNADPNKLDEFRNFVSNWGPMGLQTTLRLLVWAFIAGFSERFVPNLLDRFASEQMKDKHRSEQTATRRETSRIERPRNGICRVTK